MVRRCRYGVVWCIVVESCVGLDDGKMGSSTGSGTLGVLAGNNEAKCNAVGYIPFLFL